MKFITKNFFRGVLFLLPITLTVYIGVTVFQKIDLLGRQILGPWIRGERLLTGIGFIVTIGFIVLVGYVSSLWLGASFFNWIERQFIRTPLMRGIYGTIRDTVHSFFGEKKFFSQAVLVDFPKLGYKKIGFVTQGSAAFIEGEQEKMVVYLPHSFQISGEMIVVSKEHVKFLDLPPETALKMIMSAGIAKS